MSIEFTIQAITNTVPKYLKSAINLTLRKRFLLSYLNKCGRLVYNESGPTINWNVRYKQPDVRSTSGQKTTWQMSNTTKQLSVGFGQLEATDIIDRNTLMVNKSEGQIVNLADSMATECVRAITEGINDQIYLDNSGDASAITGFGSIFKPRVGATTDLYAIPAVGASYGGLSMELGSFGGTWSKGLSASGFPNTAMSSGSRTDWPDGSGSPQYDFLAPKMLNYTGNWSGAGSNTWRTNCEMVMRRAPLAIDALGGEGAAPAVHLLTKEMYATFQDNCQDRERLTPSDYAKSMGFPTMMEYAGAIMAWDYSCPAGVGFALNPAEVTLRSMHSDLLYTDGPKWESTLQAYLFLVGFTGNMTYNPKYMCQYGSYS